MSTEKALRKYIDSRFNADRPPVTVGDVDVAAMAMRFIQSDDFPCVGAKAALVQGEIDFHIYGSLTDPHCETSLHLDLQKFITDLRLEGPVVQSFAAIFTGTPGLTEEDFERALWRRLKGLYEIDGALNQGWNKTVSNNPNDPHFSMSLAGHPFFIVGLHPNASRLARRAPFTMLVFNSTAQFNRLREDGRFQKLQTIIRERDKALQGSINPNLSEFGEASDASQYSGRKVGADWRCPVSFEGEAS